MTAKKKEALVSVEIDKIRLDDSDIDFLANLFIDVWKQNKRSENMNGIQKYRLKAQLSQKDLAERLNLDRSTIAKRETGRALPRAKTLLLLADILNCTVDDLFESDEKSQ